jgi:hypothetical protein
LRAVYIDHGKRAKPEAHGVDNQHVAFIVANEIRSVPDETLGVVCHGKTMRSAEGTSAPTEKSAVVSRSPMSQVFDSQRIVEHCRKAGKILLSARNKSGAGGPRPSTAFEAFS